MAGEKWIAGKIEIDASQSMIDDLERIARERKKSAGRVARQVIANYIKRYDRK